MHGFEIEDNPMRYCDVHYDIIFHLAAVPRTVVCTDDPFGQPYKSNVELTNIILNHFSYDKIIYSSSCVIYGDTCDDDFVERLFESDLADPPSMYAAQKYYSEKMIDLYMKNVGKPSVCLRLFGVYGERQSQLGDYPNVVASFIKCIKEGKKIWITGDGEQSRDLIHVSDVVSAMISSMRLSEGNHIYNVCTERSVTMNYLASLISDNVEHVAKQDFDIRHMLGDAEKMRTELGWFSRITLENGIKRLLKYEGLL